MKELLIFRLSTIVVAFMVCFGGGRLANAQDLIPDKAREELNRRTAGSSSSKPVTRTRIIYIDRNAHPTISTGTLSIDALPNAIIKVEPVKGGMPLEGTLPANERLFILGNLKPGTYLVTAALDGYKPAEQKIQIVANKHKGLTLDLQPILYTVKIDANVAAGEVRYAPVEMYSESGSQERRYKPIGETRLALIQDHSAVLPQLRKGTYGVDIRASEVGFEILLGTITVPDDTNAEQVKLPVALKNVRSTAPFSSMSADQWDLPRDWRITSYLLSTSGSGVGIPRDSKRYQHYTDFQLISDVRMLNGVEASFVVRASTDKQDYYLIQLTGPNAPEPYLLSGFIVKHGMRERFESIPISHFSSALKPFQFFKISIKMKDNNIEVSIADSQTGEYFPLGVLSDSNRTFRIGAVGIAAGDKDQDQFGSFIICAPECPKQ